MKTQDIINFLAKQELTDAQAGRLVAVLAGKKTKPVQDADQAIDALANHALTDEQVAGLAAVLNAHNTSVSPEDELAYVQAYHEVKKLYPLLTRRKSMSFLVTVESDIEPHKRLAELLGGSFHNYSPDYLIVGKEVSVRVNPHDPADQEATGILANFVRKNVQDSFFVDQNVADLHKAAAQLDRIVKKYPKDFLLARLRKNHPCLAELPPVG